MTDFRQKQEDAAASAAAASEVEFRRELEELLRDHPYGCMTALASCSSGRGGLDDEDDSAAEASDLVARRRRRSDLEGVDLAESSAAIRRQSRILSCWVARQAEEMMTTMERRNRESELSALARLHTVSMLDSSFLREPRRSPSSAVERPVGARASSIFQLWREIEDESTRRERRSLGSNRNREDRLDTRADTSESDENEYGQWSNGPTGSLRDQREDEDEDGVEENRSSREQSPDLGEGERERVREIFRGWTTERGTMDQGPRISPQRNDSPRAEWLGETERERVRHVREWVQMTIQQRDARAGRREEREGERGSRDGSVTDHEDGHPEHTRRELLRVRGRQARLDLIMQIVRERQSELQGLSEHRAVSDFAHRNRIQSLLRGRFLRNGRPAEEERPPSMAARELGLLRQRHPVSGLREGFRFRLENIVRGQASSHSETSASRTNIISSNDQSQSSNLTEPSSESIEQHVSRNEDVDIHQMPEAQTVELENNLNAENITQQVSSSQEGNWQEEDTEHGRREWQDSPEVGFSEWNEATGEESDGNWQENIDRDWHRDSPGNEVGEDHIQEVHEDWHEDESNVTVETWQDIHSDPSRSERQVPNRMINRFIPPDDDNVYSMELRELLSRRSVSNLLSSGFRESLDQLIQSYVQRQARSPIDWDLEQNLQDPSLPEDGQDQQRNDTNLTQQDSVPRPPLPPPSMPPPQMWHQDLHHNNWNRHGMHRSEIEWDIINDLKADMARLQQGMNHMQRMLEACMDMQLELQRSVRQEVSAALNRSLTGKGDGAETSEDGSKWSNVRNGTCCVCCDNHIDSLLYRCGHMCTCSRCANELYRSGGKCPLCRAPIVEVIRAYSIL